MLNYQWDYNTRINEFTPKPLHNWASHGADAFRGLGTRAYIPKQMKRALKEAKTDAVEVAHRLMLRQTYGHRHGSKATKGRGGY